MPWVSPRIVLLCPPNTSMLPQLWSLLQAPAQNTNRLRSVQRLQESDDDTALCCVCCSARPDFRLCPPFQSACPSLCTPFRPACTTPQTKAETELYLKKQAETMTLATTRSRR